MLLCSLQIAVSVCQKVHHFGPWYKYLDNYFMDWKTGEGRQRRPAVLPLWWGHCRDRNTLSSVKIYQRGTLTKIWPKELCWISESRTKGEKMWRVGFLIHCKTWQGDLTWNQINQPRITKLIGLIILNLLKHFNSYNFKCKFQGLLYLLVKSNSEVIGLRTACHSNNQ